MITGGLSSTSTNSLAFGDNFCSFVTCSKTDPNSPDGSKHLSFDFRVFTWAHHLISRSHWLRWDQESEKKKRHRHRGLSALDNVLICFVFLFVLFFFCVMCFSCLFPFLGILLLVWSHWCADKKDDKKIKSLVAAFWKQRIWRKVLLDEKQRAALFYPRMAAATGKVSICPIWLLACSSIFSKRIHERFPREKPKAEQKTPKDLAFRWVEELESWQSLPKGLSGMELRWKGWKLKRLKPTSLDWSLVSSLHSGSKFCKFSWTNYQPIRAYVAALSLAVNFLCGTRCVHPDRKRRGLVFVYGYGSKRKPLGTTGLYFPFTNRVF